MRIIRKFVSLFLGSRLINRKSLWQFKKWKLCNIHGLDLKLNFLHVILRTSKLSSGWKELFYIFCQFIFCGFLIGGILTAENLTYPGREKYKTTLEGYAFSVDWLQRISTENAHWGWAYNKRYQCQTFETNVPWVNCVPYIQHDVITEILGMV